MLLIFLAGCSPGQTESKSSLSPPSSEQAVRPESNTSELVAVKTETEPAWVGSLACRECHSQRHESYLDSHHSRSLTKIDPKAEQLNVTIDHPKSHRRYEVAQRGDSVWHVEKLLESDQETSAMPPLVLSEFPIQYVMGSAKFAKSYLVADGDFLLQAPLTWYAKADAYAMSPGYDTPMHGSFSRSLTDQCLFCHAGNVERKPDNNPHHFTIHEMSIGCERCHGAGSQHVDYHRSVAGKNEASSPVPPVAKLIQPAKLSRLEAESLCAQCHRQGLAPISAPGKQDWDFHPGQDFAKVKFNYDLITTDPPETGFVGHFAQLGQSKCYQQSEMTCITCHSPHQHASGEALHQLRRKQCNSCHQNEVDSCGLELEVRMDQAKNRCVTCHMPVRDSKVPHTSTNDHRIAVHQPQTQEPSLLTSPIVLPLQEPPESMNTAVAERMDALGLFLLYRMNTGNPHMNELARNANQALADIANSGHGDAEVFGALAMLTYLQLQSSPSSSASVNQQREYAVRCAQEAIRLSLDPNGNPKPTEAFGDAMEIAGTFFSKAGQHRSAAEVFSELTAIRRRKDDWATLGLSLSRLGANEQAALALRHAIHIFAADPYLYETLAIILQKSDPEEANRCSAIAKRLRATLD
ncbi:multiheme c-type cytochrome [Rubripirellula reticaptiva]|uniref:multiheme c-type cytochrome n=1 Tax=Rubripirellula reticaptiva TaxID=2528013 RepID=UPI0016476BE2|nr:multiheme c-type cytochrome [Rubripirellula reticaptiva]